MGARIYIHTHAHILTRISVSTMRVPGTSFRNETEKLSARKEFNRISLDCSFFFYCRGLLAHLLSNRKSSPALIAAKTRRDNYRHLNPVVPNCIA